MSTPTYKASDVLNTVKDFIKQMPIDRTATTGYQIADEVTSIMWQAYPWRWTLGSFPPVNLTTPGQDFIISSLPSDFQKLVAGELVCTEANTGTTNTAVPLHVVAFLPTANTSFGGGMPSDVTVYNDGSANYLRFSPVFQAGKSYYFLGTYKKSKTLITSSNWGTAGAMVFPDEFYPVYEAGFLWRAYQYADDERAGSAQVTSDGKYQYTGQLAVFMSLIAEMRNSEASVKAYPGVDLPRDRS